MAFATSTWTGSRLWRGRNRRGEISPEEAFEKLKPFKDLVSEDIRSGRDGEDPEPG